jgi:hypothetical protein
LDTASPEYAYTFNIGAAPDRPAAVSVDAAAGTASITWTASRDNGAPVTAYHVTLQDQTASTSYDIGSCATCTQYVITALDASHAYTASVTADSSAGEGPPQVSTAFTPDTGTPIDCPDESGCVIQPLTTPVTLSMDDPNGGVFPPAATVDPDGDYYTSFTRDASDDLDSTLPQAVWKGYYLPNGYRRPEPNGYVYDTIKLAHVIERCNRSGCVKIGQVNLWVHEYINGGGSLMWDDQVHAEWVYGPRCYLEAEYQCARNISGRADKFCNEYSDKADGYDAQILTEVGRSNRQYDW